MIIALQVYNLEIGGTQKYVIDLANEYVEQGHDVHLITTSFESDQLHFEINHKIKIEIIYNSSDYKFKLKKYLINQNIELVHSSDWELWKECWFLCNSLKIKFVKTVHATPTYSLINIINFYVNPKNFFFIANLLFYKLNIINISNISSIETKKLYGSFVNSKVIYLGVEEGEVNLKKNYDIKILWAGSLTPRKQPLLALDIFQNLRLKGINCFLDIYGNGPLFDEVAEKAEILDVSVITNKVLSNDLFSDYHFTLITSLDEGTPYVLFQSLACGIPVITSRCGAVDEIISHGINGFVVDGFYPPDYCTYFEDISHDADSYRYLSESAYNCFKSSYTLKQMILNTIDFYNEIY